MIIHFRKIREQYSDFRIRNRIWSSISENFLEIFLSWFYDLEQETIINCRRNVQEEKKKMELFYTRVCRYLKPGLLAHLRE